MTDRVYLDYAASAPLVPEAAQAMEPYVEERPTSVSLGSNPNSLHTPGRDAFNAMESARAQVAESFGIRPTETVFTSCATESNNAALIGIVGALRSRGSSRPHVVTSSIEHDALFKTAKMLQSFDLADVTFVEPTPLGTVDAAAVSQAICSNTVLVSVIAAHNETGAINDLTALGQAAHDAGALFHTDAVQAAGKVPLDLHALPLDAASFSAHKMGGPKGAGMLYLKDGVPFVPLLNGGEQERGRRSGTQNVAAIAGFAAAARALCGDDDNRTKECERLVALRDRLYAGLCSIDGVQQSVPCSAGSSDYLPHVVNVLVDGVESETLVLKLDLCGFAVSGGSACSSHSLEPSRTLRALGYDRDQASGSLRVSIGRFTTSNDVDRFLDAAESTIKQLRG